MYVWWQRTGPKFSTLWYHITVRLTSLSRSLSLRFVVWSERSSTCNLLVKLKAFCFLSLSFSPPHRRARSQKPISNNNIRSFCSHRNRSRRRYDNNTKSRDITSTKHIECMMWVCWTGRVKWDKITKLWCDNVRWFITLKQLNEEKNGEK